MAMKRALIFVIVAWVLLVGISFLWNVGNAKKEHERATFQTARDYFRLLVLAREWNSNHGGVYVPVTADTKPNPYLKDPLRDLVISEELKFTKQNPAYMTRELSEIAAKKEGMRFHITSLNPIRPQNRPTPWEEKALKAFENDAKEVGEFVGTGASLSFSYMAPLRTKKECLKCHAEQGYQEGDIRGGISVSLPNVRRLNLLPMALSYTGIVLFGMVIMVFFGTRLASAYETIRQQVVTDSLTEIPNRRYFFEHLLREFRRCRREGQELSVIICDIDHFKQYNDTYGHKDGDGCLRKLAHAIRDTLKRPGDFCARYGGEEFVAGLPNTDLEAARHVAEQMRLNVENLGMEHKGSSTREFVTISLGVATGLCSDDISHEEILKRADEALYRAKAGGVIGSNS